MEYLTEEENRRERRKVNFALENQMESNIKKVELHELELTMLKN